MSDSAAIRTEGLTKHYFIGVRRRKIESVNDLNLVVNSGEIFAFLGLNGAGKTTTVKLLLDHARPTTGRAFIFGVNASNPRARRVVGYLPDLPYFYRFLTAAEMLNYAARLHGIAGPERKRRMTDLLEKVGLAGRGNEPLKGFSRGMLQRVGLAQALIGDPALVLLDEPLGGLDPFGRLELRELIAGLSKEGRTVFFNSHLLDDAQRIADRVGIIHKSRLIACGRLDELLRRRPGWEAEVEPKDGIEMEDICRRRGWALNSSGNGWRITLESDESLADLHHLAANADLKVTSLARRQVSLEEAFIEELQRWGR